MTSSFDAATTGSIQGRVTWDGAVPAAESTVIRAIAYHNALHKNPVRYETTHLPRVDAENHGVADAVVFLRGVDPTLARPWDHPAVRVEFIDRQLHLLQGEQRTGTGFLRPGDKLEARNRDVDFHALRGRGAAFFTLPLLKPDRISEQTLNAKGQVELSDAGGYYWSHAHLFVDVHPYYARTDATGSFVLEQIPPGDYEIVAWMPSWHVARKERDPETAIIARQVWAAPKEQSRTIHVATGKTEEVDFRWTKAMFDLP